MKKFNFLLMLFIMALITSCNDEASDKNNKGDNLLGSSDYPFYPSITKVSQDEITTKAGILDPKKGIARWNDFDEIKIYFMNGNTTLKNKVKEVAEIYEDLTNLTFKYTDNQNESDVRITFSNHKFDNDKLPVNWSFLGKQCLAEKKSEPTMNLSIANINDMAEINSISFKASILREFGHMLGMIYEFQRKNFVDPSERIVLDADEIYDWAGVENDKKQIYQIEQSYLMDHFFISQLLDSANISPKFDENSIMLPYIPESWFIVAKGTSKSKTKTDPDMVRKAKERTNVELSQKDKDYLAAVYPAIKPTKYVPGKTGIITLKINVEAYTMAWDFTSNKVPGENKIINDYTTRVVGEYEWTAENLRLKYKEDDKRGFMRLTPDQIRHVVKDHLGDSDKIMCERFDKIFGSFATSYGGAMAYRTPSSIIRKEGEIPETAPTNFTLPDTFAIQQLIGIAPVKGKNTNGTNHYDILNFILGIPEIYTKEKEVDLNKLIKSQMSWFMYGAKWDNSSKLGVLPVGIKGNADPNNGPKYSSLMSWGAGFQWKTKEGNMSGFGIMNANNNNAYFIRNSAQFCSVRYVRALTDKELGYKLYIDEQNDKVIVSKDLNSTPSNLKILEKGYERGIALRYINWDRYICTKKWSAIKEEANKTRNNIRNFK